MTDTTTQPNAIELLTTDHAAADLVSVAVLAAFGALLWVLAVRALRSRLVQ